MSCKCKGCETQEYYDRVRQDVEGCGCGDTKFSLTITIKSDKTTSGYSKELDYYQAYNILSEYLNVELEIGRAHV